MVLFRKLSVYKGNSYLRIVVNFEINSMKTAQFDQNHFVTDISRKSHVYTPLPSLLRFGRKSNYFKTP